MGLINKIKYLRNKHKSDDYLSWLICLGSFIAQILTGGMDISFGESLGLITKEFNSTESNSRNKLTNLREPATPDNRRKHRKKERKLSVPIILQQVLGKLGPTAVTAMHGSPLFKM